MSGLDGILGTAVILAANVGSTCACFMVWDIGARVRGAIGFRSLLAAGLYGAAIAFLYVVMTSHLLRFLALEIFAA